MLDTVTDDFGLQGLDQAFLDLLDWTVFERILVCFLLDLDFFSSLGYWILYSAIL